jgi:hypothetical protein
MSEFNEMIDTFFNGRPAASTKELQELKKALVDSVRLQSVYAALLNQYDGGDRRVYRSAREWLDRRIVIEESVVKPVKRKWYELWRKQ